MPAVLEFRLTGGSGNSDPDASLGGVMSATKVSATALNNLFDYISSAEASAGDTEYRAFDIYNSGDETATDVEFWGAKIGTTDVACTTGEDATNNPHAAATDLETLTNESTAPASPTITFADNVTGLRLELDDIPSTQAARIFVRRICPPSEGNDSNAGITLNVEYA